VAYFLLGHPVLVVAPCSVQTDMYVASFDVSAGRRPVVGYSWH